MRGTGDVVVEVQLDGRPIGQATPTLDRPDVFAVFQEFLHSGWSIALTVEPSWSGKILEVVAFDDEHKKSLGQRTLRVTRTGSTKHGTTMGGLDHPRHGDTVTGNVLHVTGWAIVDGEAADTVELILDDEPPSRLRRGEPRPDILAAEQTGLTFDIGAGYSGVVPIRGRALPPALPLRIRATGSSGNVWMSGPITVGIEESAPLQSLPEPTLARRVPPRSPIDSRPRIAVFVHSLDLGGGELYIQELLLRLATNATMEFLVISPRDGVLRAELESAGIPVHLGSPMPLEPKLYVDRVTELCSILATWRCDAVLANTLATFIGVDAALSCRIPVVWAIHESFDIDVFNEAYWGRQLPTEIGDRARSALRGADLNVFVADATRKMFEEAEPTARTRTVRYGIDLEAIATYQDTHDREELRSELGFTDSDRILLCMGIVQERKSQFALLHAFASILDKSPHSKLIIVGFQPTPYGLAVRKAIDDLNLGHAVRLVDVDPDTYKWFMISDILVSASDTESLPRSILEAMAFGLPVLAADVFGVSEVVEDGTNGWLFEARNGAAVSAAIARAATSSETDLFAMSQRNRYAALSFDGSNYAREYEALLKDLIDKRDPRRD
ncbi:glycosyltransferase family 4 protein [Rhodococcus sp. NPDC003382]